MAFVLENELCRAEFVEKAGEIKSFYDKEKNREIMYQGNEAWKGSNPSLFPLVGNTLTGEYVIDGQTYSMKNHGLARYATMKGEQKENSVVMSFDSDDNTRSQYPFDFHYEMEYTLVGKTLQIEYRITNTSNREMPFTFGLHPAFICARSEDEKYEDFSIDFEEVENCQQMVFDPVFDKPVHYEDRTMDKWQLSREDLYKYKTIIYKDLKSKYVTLSYKDEGRVKVKIAGYPLLALWSIETPSNYVCIEPWYGHADFVGGITDFYTREGTMLLQPNDTFACDYSIEAL